MRLIVFCILLPALLLGESALGQEIKVLTNHVGYERNAAKRFVVLGHKDDDVTAFRVLDARTGVEAASGVVEKVGPVDQSRDWIFWNADFSGLDKDGSYIIECATSRGAVRSFPFLIQQDLLERNTLSNVIYYFKTQRNAGQQEKADRNLKFEDSTDPNKRLDLHGGWADATGDSGKHLSHLSFATYFNPQHGPLTAWLLFKTEEELKARGGKNFAQLRKRLTDEALFGADFLCRWKNPNGSFYRSVDDGNPRFVAKDGSGGIIKKQKNPNLLQQNEADLTKISGDFLYEIGFRSGGGVSIAALALASTNKLCGEYTNAQYLQAAQDGYAFLKQYNLYYTNDGKENIIDDYCILLAATELYRATKDELYKTDADARAKNLIGRMTEQGYWRADDGDRPFYHAVDAGLPVVALLNYHGIAAEPVQKQILDTVRKSLAHEIAMTSEVPNAFGYARQFVQSKSGDRRTTFFYPHDAGTAPWWQGENARLASLASAARMAAKFFKDDKPFHDQLEVYAADQLNWILGLNPFDACMLHGSGRNNLFYEEGGVAYTPAPGGICNGITAGFDNPHDIDFAPKNHGNDSWRWAEQWLPHAHWYMYAAALGDR